MFFLGDALTLIGVALEKNLHFLFKKILHHDTMMLNSLVFLSDMGGKLFDQAFRTLQELQVNFVFIAKMANTEKKTGHCSGD